MISMLRRSIFAPVLISLLAACSPGGGSGASFVNTDITGASYGKDFRLTDHTGAVRSLADVERIREGVETRLAPIGHKVNAVVNYDRFSIVPELVDDYISMVKDVMARHYHDVTRYTSSTFLRMKLGEAMEKHQIAPRLYENADEAQGKLGKA